MSLMIGVVPVKSVKWAQLLAEMRETLWFASQDNDCGTASRYVYLWDESVGKSVDL